MTDSMTGMMTESDFFKHYGKKGMKWGVRKAPSGPASADAARVNKIKTRAKKNGLDNLSNDDIAKLNKRNQLISEYKKANPGLVKRGHDATKQALAIASTAGAVVVIGGKVASNPQVRRGAAAVAMALKNL